MNETQINIRSAQAINLAHQDFSKCSDITQEKTEFKQRALFYYEVLGEFSKTVMDWERRQEENKHIPEENVIATPKINIKLTK